MVRRLGGGEKGREGGKSGKRWREDELKKEDGLLVQFYDEREAKSGVCRKRRSRRV